MVGLGDTWLRLGLVRTVGVSTVALFLVRFNQFKGAVLWEGRRGVLAIQAGSACCTCRCGYHLRGNDHKQGSFVFELIKTVVFVI